MPYSVTRNICLIQFNTISSTQLSQLCATTYYHLTLGYGLKSLFNIHISKSWLPVLLNMTEFVDKGFKEEIKLKSVQMVHPNPRWLASFLRKEISTQKCTQGRLWDTGGDGRPHARWRLQNGTSPTNILVPNHCPPNWKENSLFCLSHPSLWFLVTAALTN